jgi:hypothetical protein
MPAALLFLRQGLANCMGWPWIQDSPTSASWLAGIIGMCHQAQLPSNFLRSFYFLISTFWSFSIHPSATVICFLLTMFWQTALTSHQKHRNENIWDLWIPWPIWILCSIGTLWSTSFLSYEILLLVFILLWSVFHTHFSNSAHPLLVGVPKGSTLSFFSS